MNYSQAIEFLHSLNWFGANLGLDNTRKLAALAGNPHERLRFIHVAGTNGKGSTCAMLESIYREAGLRVGLYTSPHLVSFRERLQVNRQLISEADVVRLVEECQPWVRQVEREQQPTFFEAVTVMALRHFAEQKCDLVIWETGLGGRLDATNIVTPLASVITNIGLDHQHWLGDTLEKIAAEKAGIIKPGVPVLTAATQPEALRAIGQVVHDKHANLTVINTELGTRNLEHLPLGGEHQRLNAALAVATVEALRNTFPVNAETIRRGLETVHWPGRLQLVTRPSGQRVLLDGAHNTDGAEVLSAALRAGAPASESARFNRAGSEFGDPTLILGILADKDWRAMCRILAPLANRALLVPVVSERTMRPEELATLCRIENPDAEVVSCGSLAEALARSSSDPFVVIAGSLYLIGEAMEQLGISPVPSTDEKILNNWQPAKLKER